MTPPLKKTRHPGIYQSGSAYIVRYRDHSGRQRQRTCRTLDEAKSVRAKVTLNPAAGSPRSGPTVESYATEWLGMLVAIRGATAFEYRRDLEKYILPKIGRIRMGALDARRIRRLAYDLREEKTVRAPKGRSWSTVRRILAPLSVMLSAATEDGVIPAKPWPRLPTARRDPTKRRHLSVEELVRLLAAMSTAEDRLLVRFLAETALRVSELKALRWGDLELNEDPRVNVRRRHRAVDGEQTTKTERSASDVPITRELARDLKAHRLRTGRPAREALVFTSEEGVRIEEVNYRRRVLDPACKRAGLDPIGFHVLRHTHGTIVAAATCDLRVVQRRLRHASASFTLETYVHLLDDRAGSDSVARATDPGGRSRRRQSSLGVYRRGVDCGRPGRAVIERCSPVSPPAATRERQLRNIIGIAADRHGGHGNRAPRRVHPDGRAGDYSVARRYVTGRVVSFTERGTSFGMNPERAVRMSIEQEIATWAVGRPLWQQAALRQLAQGHVFDQAEIDGMAANLAAGTLVQVTPLKASEVPGAQPAATTVALRSIRDTTNVNALLDGQQLTFAPSGLTIVYGDNGSGKSGYARLIKDAVGARHREPVHANVFVDSAGQPQQAEIGFVSAGTDKGARWPGVDSELGAISFYDEACGDAYIGGESELTYRPSALSLLDGLIVVCDAVRKVLDERLRSNESTRMPLPVVAQNTDAARCLASLTGTTTPAQLDAACALPAGASEQLGALIQEEARLRATNPAMEGSRLDTLASKIDRVANHIATVAGTLSDAKVNEATTARQRAIDLRTAATVASSDAFEAEPIGGVGSEAWRALWEAARVYSIGEAYHGQHFPVTGPDARCVLCQQELNVTAAERLERFEAFLQDTTAQQASSAEGVAVRLASSIRALDVTPAQIAADLVEVEAAEETLASSTSEWLTTAANRRTAILAALDGNDGVIPALGPPPHSLLTARANELRAAATAIDSTQFQATLTDTVAKKNDLEARRALSQQRATIEAEIMRLAEHAKLEEAKRLTDTTGITRKASDLTDAHVTNLIRDRFTRESDRLRLERIELRKTGGQKGKLRHRPSLLGAKTPKPVDEVLSEGEQTALGLAGYFTEAHFDASKSALVLDDPVTSLDHIRRHRVAHRLAELSQDRQVIVFTHDVAFVGDLRRAADEVQVDFTERGVQRRGDGTPGLCTDQHPWKAKDVPRRFDDLARDLARIKRERAQFDQGTYEKECSDWAGRLSETWERLINTEVVYQIVDPGTSEVRPKLFKLLVKITDQDDREFQQSYGRISAWARRHDKSPLTNYVAPEPAELEHELAFVKTWFDRVKKYRNT